MKEIKFKNEARLEIKKGIDILADTVKVTLGPMGRNVLIEHQFKDPTSTKDGVSVAKEIFLDDPLQNIGAQLVKQVASKTADDAGDGTSTATILAQSIYAHGINAVSSGANPIAIKNGIDWAVRIVVDSLKSQSKPISTNEEIKQIATISANNDSSIGDIIAKAMKQVGKEGVISPEETSGTKTEVVFAEGMKIGSGYLSPYFANDENTKQAILENPVIIIYDKTISTLADVLPILEQVKNEGRSVLIVSNDIEGEALQTLVVNKMNGLLKVAAIKVPGFGDDKTNMLEDIAILTGGQLISEARGHKLIETTFDMLGVADKVIVTKDSTTIIKKESNKLMVDRIVALKTLIEAETSKQEKNNLKVRLARLTNGVAIIKIGAATEMEMGEKKDRIDDALQATVAAVEEGILPGGGVALIRAQKGLRNTNKISDLNPDFLRGAQIIEKAILDPFKCILDNAGLEYPSILETIRNNKKDYGFDVKNNTYGNLLKLGVIDPTKVVRLSLENAASIASLLLTTEAVIYESEKTRTLKTN